MCIYTCRKRRGEGKRDRIQFNILEFLLGLGRVAEEVDLKVALQLGFHILLGPWIGDEERGWNREKRETSRETWLTCLLAHVDLASDMLLKGNPAWPINPSWSYYHYVSEARKYILADLKFVLIVSHAWFCKMHFTLKDFYKNYHLLVEVKGN